MVAGQEVDRISYVTTILLPVLCLPVASCTTAQPRLTLFPPPGMILLRMTLGTLTTSSRHLLISLTASMSFRSWSVPMRPPSKPIFKIQTFLQGPRLLLSQSSIVCLKTTLHHLKPLPPFPTRPRSHFTLPPGTMLQAPISILVSDRYLTPSLIHQNRESLEATANPPTSLPQHNCLTHSCEKRVIGHQKAQVAVVLQLVLPELNVPRLAHLRNPLLGLRAFPLPT